MRGGDWIAFDADADLHGAGIYLWQVGDESYVGKASRLSRRLHQYLRNVDRIETGRPYRRANPDGFRRIHRALHAAKAGNARVMLTILESCERGPCLLDRERHWIAKLQPNLNGPRPIEAP